jgi:hypothetical protein
MSRPLTRAQLVELGVVLQQTRPVEIGCDEWLDAVGGYAESVAWGKPAPTGVELVVHHLEICPECKEEFDALVAALKGG